MDGLHLIYFTDAMCSWCWGFSPVIGALRAKYGDALPIRTVVGGLRPGTETPMDRAHLNGMRPHWEHVTEASGQPFDYGFFDREGFIYDTDPAARAVVLARREGPLMALDYLRSAQQAFYAQNRDVTQPAVLAELAGELGMDPTTFEANLYEDDVKQETWRDYAISQNAGVRGFPTLIAGPGADGTFTLITRGFNTADNVLPMVDRWLKVTAVS
jgi:putative protein-disulfide isomerase